MRSDDFEVDDDDPEDSGWQTGAAHPDISWDSGDSRYEFDSAELSVQSFHQQVANMSRVSVQDQQMQLPSEQMEADDEEEKDVKRLCLDTMPSSQGNSTITDDSVMCPVCFEAWTSDGTHRIISLKCGHIFGLSCIEKWMTTTKKCPTCNQAVRKTDIRNLFVRSLKAIDTSERNSLTKQITEKEAEIARIKMHSAMDKLTVTQVQQELHGVKQEVERLKKELHQKEEQLRAFRSQGNKAAIHTSLTSLQSANHTATSSSSGSGHRPDHAVSRMSFAPSGASQFQQVKKSEVCGTGGCRVMASCQGMDTIAISHKNPNSLFSGHGVTRIGAHDYKLSDFIPIHADLIMDMCFKPNDPLLLTASMDKTVKLTSLIDKSIVTTFNLPCQARSCCWHPSNGNGCFVGLNSGDILVYDIRNASVPTHQFDGIASNPLISVQFVSKEYSSGCSDANSQDDSIFNGLLCNSLSTCFFVEIGESGDIMSKQSLPFEGRFLPSHYDQKSGYGLISIRPSEKQKQLNVQHHVIQLKKDPNTGISSEVVQKFGAGALSECLSKSKVFMNPSSFDRQPYVFAADEQNGGILLYDLNGRRMKQVIKNSDKIMDIGLVSAMPDKMRVAALTDRGITFYEKNFLY